jgi:hypothetical protein
MSLKQIETDEKVPVMLPAVIDNDGDVLVVTSVEYISEDPSIVTFVQASDGTLNGVAESTGVAGGPVKVIARVLTDSGAADYAGEVVVVQATTGAPVGGELGFGTETKR